MLGNFANTDQNLLKEGFALRLRNPRFNCFLNTALNSVISNELLLNRILNPSIEISGELRVLFEHLDIENIGEFSNENLISLLEFHCYDTDGCAKVHGDECFSVIKKNLKERIAELKIIDEIKFLALREGINETLKLRGLLSQRFSGFSADIQYDAGEAFYVSYNVYGVLKNFVASGSYEPEFVSLVMIYRQPRLARNVRLC